MRRRIGFRRKGLTLMPLLTPELLCRFEQFQLLAARRAGHSPSAKRMNMNSRGCQPTESPSRIVSDPEGVESSTARPSTTRMFAQSPHRSATSGPGFIVNVFHECEPTEQRPEINSTLKGSNHDPSRLAPSTSVEMVRMVRPYQGREILMRCSVGFTHGYSSCSPPANATLPRTACKTIVIVCHPDHADSTSTH
jgi:hypothetical protein